MNPKDFFKPYSKVKEVVENLTNNKDLPLDTFSAVVLLTKLDDFLDQMRSTEANAIRIVLCREKNDRSLQLHEALDYEPATQEFTQVSIVIIPHNATQDTLGWNHNEDVYEDGSILCLFPGGENTGLCPPRCGSI